MEHIVRISTFVCMHMYLVGGSAIIHLMALHEALSDIEIFIVQAVVSSG